MNFLQFYRYLVGLLSTEGVYKAIATFQALLRQESALLHDLKQRNWDTAALSILNLENLAHNEALTEIELHCALMNLMQQVERYDRLHLDAKANFLLEISSSISNTSEPEQETERFRIQKLLSELYHFGPVTVEHILQIGTLLEVKKGRKILEGDDSNRKVAILLRGAVRGYYKKGKNKNTLFALTEGAVIADFIRLFNHEDESKLIFESFEACEILVFNYEDLVIKQIQYHEISLDTQRFLEAQLIETLIRIKFLLLNDGKQRVKELNNSDRGFLQRFNRKDMACYIALSPEAFARISKVLKDDKRKSGEEEDPNE